MDLTLTAGEYTLNVRVHVIVETEHENGSEKSFVFFRSKGGHLACVGGRVKAGESSLAAAQRELEEETGLNFLPNKFKLISTIENFYTTKNSDTIKANNNSETDTTKFHEIGFVYLLTEKVPMQNISENFIIEHNLLTIPYSEIQNSNILPAAIKEIILEDKLNEFSTFIVN
jgi:8-oxo-dGTP pyrophosphatase MutT (NUDIX family)